MRDPFERELRFHVRALSRAEEDCGLDVAHEFGGRGVLIVRERQRGRETTMRGEVLGVERRRIAIQADRRGALTALCDGCASVRRATGGRSK